jgi:hypothetical protein
MKHSSYKRGDYPLITQFVKGSLYISGELVVLCTYTDETLLGVVVCSDGIYETGDYDGEWALLPFTKFTGTVTLED